MTPLTYIFVKKLVTARQARKKRRQEAKLNSSN
jgi:hypothetical protein